MITVKQIIAQYLKAHNYDGLYTKGCGCQLVDLIPCCDNVKQCKPGYCHIDKDGYWFISPIKKNKIKLLERQKTAVQRK